MASFDLTIIVTVLDFKSTKNRLDEIEAKLYEIAVSESDETDEIEHILKLYESFVKFMSEKTIEWDSQLFSLSKKVTTRFLSK